MSMTAHSTAEHSMAAVPEHLLSELGDSRPLLSAPEQLRAVLDTDGYIYLRNVLPLTDVLAAREEIAQRLIEVKEIKPPALDAIATGTSERQRRVGNLGAFWRSVSEGPALRQVTHNPILSQIAGALFNTSACGQDFIFLRAVPKNRFNGPHCDSPFFTRKTEQVLTFWIPLGDIPASDGPLYIIENSHQCDHLNHAIKGFDVANDQSRRATSSDDPITLATRQGVRLLTRDFATGDVLVFGMYTWHGSFANCSTINRVRLSVDVRYQPQSAPRDPRYFGTDPGGTTGSGYGELNGARPLTEDWHIR